MAKCSTVFVMLLVIVAWITSGVTAELKACTDTECKVCTTVDRNPNDCQSNGGSSVKFVCGATVAFLSYNNPECRGTPIVTTDFGAPGVCHEIGSGSSILATCAAPTPAKLPPAQPPAQPSSGPALTATIKACTDTQCQTCSTMTVPANKCDSGTDSSSALVSCAKSGSGNPVTFQVFSDEGCRGSLMTSMELVSGACTLVEGNSISIMCS